jgi:hypothetical protein
MLDKHHPLWLPEGSIRSLIAILVAIVFALAALQLRLFTAAEILEVVKLVFGWYFLSRVAQAAIASNGGGGK